MYIPPCCRALKGSRYKGNGKLPEQPLVYYGWDSSTPAPPHSTALRGMPHVPLLRQC
jgi:hypothetical protein